MWPFFNTVNHLNGVIHSHSVTPSSKCYLFIKAWPILFLVNFSQFYPFFPNVTYFSQSDPFVTVWLIFPNKTLFYSETYRFKVSPIFHSVTNFLQRNTFFDKYFMFHIFHTLKMELIFHIVKELPIFLKFIPYFTVWQIFPNVTHCLLCDSIFSVTHFSKSG